MTPAPDAPAPPSSADAPTAPALVSVIVRSMDRSFLQEALSTVAAQTYPHIEVVVVAVRPNHAPLSATAGPVPLRLIATNEPRPRSRAANVGLDHAQGQYLLFLDDDDWLMPGHIARLVATLQAHPSAQAAYTGVALVDLDNHPSGNVFDYPFDAVRQMAGNLTPIHAVLFDASLVHQGHCRFDETLDRYEDWDFWLQMARRTAFVHLPGVSAAYRIHESSGVHVDAPQSSLRLYEKWQGQWGPREIGELMRRVWSHDEVETKLNTSEERRRLAEQNSQAALAAMAIMTQQIELRLEQRLEQQAASLNTLAAELSQQTARADHAHQDYLAVLGSTSWQVTQPLRWLGAMASRLAGRRRR